MELNPIAARGKSPNTAICSVPLSAAGVILGRIWHLRRTPGAETGLTFCGEGRAPCFAPQSLRERRRQSLVFTPGAETGRYRTFATGRYRFPAFFFAIPASRLRFTFIFASASSGQFRKVNGIL